MTGIERIAKERERQTSVEGWTTLHDDSHIHAEMALAAACYASPIPIRARLRVPVSCGCRSAECEHTLGFSERDKWVDPWPWDKSWDKRGKHDRIRQLEIAGALVAAEIDRLQREKL